MCRVPNLRKGSLADITQHTNIELYLRMSYTGLSRPRVDRRKSRSSDENDVIEQSVHTVINHYDIRNLRERARIQKSSDENKQNVKLQDLHQFDESLVRFLCMFTTCEFTVVCPVQLVN